jgi:hypothetical protein
LNQRLWTFIDPQGDAEIALNGSQLALSIPGNVQHELEPQSMLVPRIMQPAQDSDFEIEVKFDSKPGEGRDQRRVGVQK